MVTQDEIKEQLRPSEVSDLYEELRLKRCAVLEDINNKLNNCCRVCPLVKGNIIEGDADCQLLPSLKTGESCKNCGVQDELIKLNDDYRSLLPRFHTGKEVMDITEESVRTAKRNGISKQVLRKRLDNGMPLEDAVSLPAGKALIFEGLPYTAEQFDTARSNGISKSLLDYRIANNIPVETAISLPTPNYNLLTKERKREAQYNGLTYQGVKNAMMLGYSVEEAVKGVHLNKNHSD